MAYAPPKYPGNIPTAEDLPDRADDVDWMYAARYNELKKELRAALIELGTLPKGGHTDVKTRLDTLGPGDVVGPASALDEAIVRYKGTSGKLIQATLGAKIDDTGRLTNTAQPAFLVRPSGTQSNIATNTAVTVIFGTEIFDQGNNFASNIFTAPVTGRYLLNYRVVIDAVDVDATSYKHSIVTSNRAYDSYYRSSQELGADGIVSFIGSVVVDMDTNDTAYIIIHQFGGAAQSDLLVESSFSGCLVC